MQTMADVRREYQADTVQELQKTLRKAHEIVYGLRLQSFLPNNCLLRRKLIMISRDLEHALKVANSGLQGEGK